jgi:RHS repeat-associated protein
MPPNRSDAPSVLRIPGAKLCFFAAGLISILALNAYAADKSGVSPQVITLPTGPASIDGMGESFEPQYNSGTFTFRLPLSFPKVRGKASPQVDLSYNSGYGNGCLGLGWRLSVPFIRRQADKGLPQYDSNDTFTDFAGEELIATQDGYYRAENESAFTRHQLTSTNGWLCTLRDGTLCAYGVTLQGRLERTPGETFFWMLEWTQDLNGNRAEYQYFKDSNQIYLDEIRYGLHATAASRFYRIKFGYEAERPDSFTDYRGRFRSETRQRLKEITLFYGERRIRHWKLAYQPDSPVSLLKSFVVYGDERSDLGENGRMNRDFLPPMNFEYSTNAFGTGWQMIQVPGFQAINLGSGEAQLMDVNQDGLPDILLYEQGKFLSSLNQGPGRPFAGLQPFSSPVYYPPLSEPSTRLADLRGDGSTKVLVLDDDGQFYYRHFTSPTTLGRDVDFFIPGNFRLDDAEIRFVDINNDRAIDMMAAEGDSLWFLVNAGEGKTNYIRGPIRPPSNARIRFSEGWQLADMNGDRLQDLVLLGTRQEGGCVVHLCKGWGEFEPAMLMNGGPSDANFGPRRQAAFNWVDVDQDGLSDLVQVESGLVRFWLNRGAAWSDPPHSITDLQIPDYNEGQTTVLFADMNGNGSVDIVWNDLSLGRDAYLQYLELHPRAKPHQLTRMHNGLGKTLEIEYRSSTDYMIEAEKGGEPWTRKIPFPVPVVAAFAERDSLGSFYRTEITYRDGYYDGQEREFRGFEQTIVKEAGQAAQGAPSLLTQYEFHTGEQVEALKGKPKAIEVRDEAGSVFSRKSQQWLARNLPLTLATNEARKVSFSFVQAATNAVIEQGPLNKAVTLVQEYEYDDFGNLTLETDYGRVEGGDRSAWDDERIKARVFSAAYPSGRQLWILNLPVQEEIRNEQGQVIFRRQSFYDDPAFSGQNAGQVSKGNLTLARDYIDPVAGKFVNAVRNEFDIFGNVTGMFDPLGVPGQLGRGHFRRIDYDSEIHSHPVQETIFTGNVEAQTAGQPPTLVVKVDYDLGLGVPRQSLDFNGSPTLYRYDPFARLEHLVKPGDSEAVPTASFSYVLGQDLGGGRILNWVESRLRETAGGGTVDSRKFYDGFGRVIMNRAEGEFPGQVVVTDTVQFNNRKRNWKKYLPYFESGTLDFVDPTYNTGFQEMHYDALGRIVRTYQPVDPNGGSRSFAETVYEPLSQLLRDEEQSRTNSVHFGCGKRFVYDGLKDKDGKERLRIVEEIVKLTDDGYPLPSDGRGAGGEGIGTVAWTTRYTYDLLDNFTGYTDAQNNQKFFAYDGLSRKVFMNDPDRGFYWWAYDDAGNTIRTRDAKGQEIAYDYDGVNRITSEWYTTDAERLGGNLAKNQRFEVAGIPQRAADVAYHYDVAGGPQDRGALWKDNGSTQTILDVILQRVPEDKRLDLTGDGVIDVRDLAKSISSGVQQVNSNITAENTLGQLSWVRDQSGEEHNSFDARGRTVWRLKRIKNLLTGGLDNFLTQNNYDSMDRQTRHVYPDGTAADYAYNSRGLLESVSQAINSFDYNPAGQNLRLALACGVVTEYAYDYRLRLERLKSLRSRDGLALQDYRYTFDEVSNITRITDGRSSLALDTIGTELGITSEAARRFNATQDFQYDSLYRLIESANTAVYGSIRHRYDRIGNMLLQDAQLLQPDPLMNLGQMTSGGATGTSGRVGREPSDPPGPHALTQIRNPKSEIQNYPYDANGNMTTDRGMSLFWDHKDRLAGLSTNQTQATYLYDYTDIRKVKLVKEPTGTNQVQYVDKVSELRNAKLVKYLYAGSYRIARSDGAPSKLIPVRFYLSDHLGSAVQALDQAAKVNEELDYYPFGRVRVAADFSKSTFLNYRFSGKESDTESGFYYFEARHLSAVASRFVSVDPYLSSAPAKGFASPGNFTAYAYGESNPVNRVDPDGRASRPSRPAPLQDAGASQDFGAALVNTMRLIQVPKSSCASAVRQGLEKTIGGAFDIRQHGWGVTTQSAADMGPLLEKEGFTRIGSSLNDIKHGDIIIWDRDPRMESISARTPGSLHGHVEVYDADKNQRLYGQNSPGQASRQIGGGSSPIADPESGVAVKVYNQPYHGSAQVLGIYRRE